MIWLFGLLQFFAFGFLALALAQLTSNTLYHFYFGLMSVVSFLLCHCWVFFYFIGTGEGIREGILKHQLDTTFIKKTKKMKGKVFPFALFAMIFMIVTAIMGGAKRFESSNSHLYWAIFTILFNLYTAWREAKFILINEKIMLELNAKII